MIFCVLKKKMKLYNYAIRTYRVYIVRRILLLIFTLILTFLEITSSIPDIPKNKTMWGALFDIGFASVVIVAFIHNVIENKTYFRFKGRSSE